MGLALVPLKLIKEAGLPGMAKFASFRCLRLFFGSGFPSALGSACTVPFFRPLFLGPGRTSGIEWTSLCEPASNIPGLRTLPFRSGTPTAFSGTRGKGVACLGS
uniref:Uncharacterized protein n=1 Tax=Opuntia streptacantha TaxID=393608 RepID=A0A7C9E528_OPUST